VDSIRVCHINSELVMYKILNRLDYDRSCRESIVSGRDLRVLIKWTQLGGSVEGSNHSWCEFLHTCLFRTGQWKAYIIS